MADGSEVRRAASRRARTPGGGGGSLAGGAQCPGAVPTTRGFYWSETTGSHVVYERQGPELARLLVADFDPAVTAIAAQPFPAAGRLPTGGSAVTCRTSSWCTLTSPRCWLNVKPAGPARRPGGGRGAGMAGAARARSTAGITRSGAALTRSSWPNVRFLAGYRRPVAAAPPGPGGCGGWPRSRPGDTLAALAGPQPPGLPPATHPGQLHPSWPGPAVKRAYLLGDVVQPSPAAQ